MVDRRCLLHNARPRCARVLAWRSLRVVLGPSWVHPFDGICGVAQLDLRQLDKPFIRDKPGAPLGGVFDGCALARRARCDDRWRAWRGVFLAARSNEIFLSVSAHSCVIDVAYRCLRSTRTPRTGKRKPLGLDTLRPDCDHILVLERETESDQFNGMIVVATSFGMSSVTIARCSSSGWIKAKRGTGCGTVPGGRARSAGKSINGDMLG